MINNLRNRTMIAWLVAIIMIVLATVVGVNATRTESTGKGVPATQTAVTAPALPACEYEDGSTQRSCYWDAQRQGNGKGWSMIHMNYGKQTIIVSWLPASCKAVSQLPGYELPANDHDAIRGLVSGVEMITMLVDAKVKRADMIKECNAYLFQWASDHPKAV